MRKLTILFAAFILASTQLFAASVVVGDCFVSGDLRYKITSLSTDPNVPNTVEVTTAGIYPNQHYPLTAGATSVTIPEYVAYNGARYTVTKIGGGSSPVYGAFYNSGLQTINIAPKSQITEIGESAFYKSAITAITLPASVATIGQQAFASCTALSTVTVLWTSNATIPTPGSDVFSGIATGAVLKVPIGTKALYEAKGWNQWFTIDAPAPARNQIFYQSSNGQVVTPYKTNVFGATILSNTYDADADYGIITFDGDVTTIGDEAFSRCGSLLSITIPEGVTGVGTNSFLDCWVLTSVTLPASLQCLVGYCFNGCTSLHSITCKAAEVPACGYACFENVPTTAIVSVPFASIDAYKNDGEWKYFTNFATCQTLAEIYADGVARGKAEALGEMATPCTDCHAIEVTKGDKTVTLYAPESVDYIKVE